MRLLAPSMAVVTISEMRHALINTLGKQGMSPEEISALAEQIMNYFGFDDCVMDNTLTSGERDIFYMLEEAGFLTTIQEEVPVAKGKIWRLHYWVLHRENIRRFARIGEEKKVDTDEFNDFYKNLEDSAWYHQF